MKPFTRFRDMIYEIHRFLRALPAALCCGSSPLFSCIRVYGTHGACVYRMYVNENRRKESYKSSGYQCGAFDIFN